MKTYTGIELLQAIKDGEIKEHDKFKINCKHAPYIFYDGYTFRWDDDDAEILKVNVFTTWVFTPIEKNQAEENRDIDIQDIKETDITVIIKGLTDSENDLLGVIRRNQYKINELVKAVKQLDRQINNN